MKHPLGYLWGAAIFWLFMSLGGCSSIARSTDPDTRTRQEHEGRRSKLAEILQRETIQLDSEIVGFEDRRPFVIVIGENHASIAAQQNLSATLADLRRHDLLDAVLIEGTSGNVAVDDVRGALGTGISWDDALAWGQISGYEHFVLTTPTAPAVFGVEDMVEKFRYSYRAEIFIDDRIPYVSTIEHAIETIDQNITRLEPKAATTAIASLGQHRANLEALKARLTSRSSALRKKSNELGLVALVDTVAPNAAEVSRLQADVDPDVQSAAGLYAEYQAAVAAHNERAQQAQKRDRWLRATPSGGPAFDEMNANLHADLQWLAESKTKIDTLERRLEDLQVQLASITAAMKKLEAQQQRLTKATKSLEPEVEELAELLRASQDEVFATLNELEDLRQAHDLEFAGVSSFFEDAARIERNVDIELTRGQLAARDAAMIENTSTYLEDHGPAVVVLVVGSHHLPGIRDRLAEHGIAHVIATVLPGSADVAPWEQAAWSRRRNASLPAFSSAEIKEITRLVNRTWKADVAARRSFFRDLGDRPVVARTEDGSLRSFEVGRGPDHRIVDVSKAEFNPEARHGAHVIDLGGVPGKPREHYRVTSTAIADASVRDLSNRDSLMVYIYPTNNNGTTSYRARVRKSTEVVDVSVRDELSAIVHDQSARDVMIFGDTEQTSSRVVRHLKLATGGGGSRRPPGGSNNGTTGSSGKGGSGNDGGYGRAGRPGATPAGLPTDPHRTTIHHTINPQRARRNIDAIAKMDPRRLGRVQLVDGSFEDLRRTPSTGEGSQTVVIVAENTPEFRANLQRAIKERRFENKQVALITCADVSIPRLREKLLDGGSVMVYALDRQVDPLVARRVAETAAGIAEQMGDQRPVNIGELMDRTLKHLEADESMSKGELAPLQNGASWVEVDFLRFVPTLHPSAPTYLQPTLMLGWG